jgi:hypothetical protein
VPAVGAGPMPLAVAHVSGSKTGVSNVSTSPKDRKNMDIKAFAKKHRRKLSHDECGDEIIQGRLGHLYSDGQELCLMVINGVPVNRSRWAALGGRRWMGEISPGPKSGRKVQDVKITGIPLRNAKLAIRMIKAKPKRTMSEAQKVALTKARSSSPLRGRMQRHPLESSASPSATDSSR